MELAEQDNFPSFSFYRRLERHQSPIPEQFSPEPLPPYRAANEKGDRRAANVSQQGNQEAPPKTEEKPCAHAQNAARKQEHVATGVKQRIPNGAPGSPAHDVLLDLGDEIDDRKNAGEQKERGYHDRQPGKLKNYCAAHLDHRGTLTAANASRKLRFGVSA
jgi:hypothetical protein